MRFAEFAALCRQLERTPGRRAKVGLVARFLRALSSEELPAGIAFLLGRPLPVSDPRVLEVSGSTLARLRSAAQASSRDAGGARAGGDDGRRAAKGADTGEPAAEWPEPPNLPAPGSHTAGIDDTAGDGLTLPDVSQGFAGVADASGAGSRAVKLEHLRRLFARATPDESEWLARILFGEMRTGVSDGLVLDAIAQASQAGPGLVRRASMFLGDPAAVAALAMAGGVQALEGTTPRLFVPLLPMLAEIATDFDVVLAAHGGRSALEYKYDGARIQLHRDGERVGIWSRRLSDVTAGLPDIVDVARELRARRLILDGEVVAIGDGGRPLPFQDLMRRFRRVHRIEDLVREIPLALHFFDCLQRDDDVLIDRTYEERWEILAAVTGGRYLAARSLVTTREAAEAFQAGALAAGHEGVMAKDPRSTYSPGSRGKRWFKIKAPATVDCVILAADRGSGRRTGWLSNYHLGVRQGDGFADVGKTFKGLTDREFTEMTERLRASMLTDDGYTVRVRPQVVVEVEYNDIQKSPRYPSGLALRFARIARVRDDKAPGQATTLDELRELYERQFATKSRMLESRGL
jgi:DNA ligase 1